MQGSRPRLRFLSVAAGLILGGLMHFKTASKLFFALTMIAIGVMGLVSGAFAPIFAGVPKSLPDRQLLADLSTAVSLACGVGLMVKRTTGAAAFVLFAYLLLWTILFKVPFIIRQPLVEVSYQSCGESAVLTVGAWVLYASSASGTKGSFGFLRGNFGLHIAYFLYGLALIAFGLSHFAYLDLTEPLVPAWLPAPLFWACLTGGIYLVSGALLVSGFAARLGAALAAVQIALITLLVWGPMVLEGHMSAGRWQETVVSWALTAAAAVIAASFDERAWIFERTAARCG